MTITTGQAALQTAQPPPAVRPVDQNEQATRGTSAPGDVSRTEAVGAVGTPATTEPTGPLAAPSAEDLNAAIADLRNSVDRVARSYDSFNLQFRVDTESERTVISVVDPSTDEVVRQIPSEEVLALAAKLKEFADTGGSLLGALLNETG